MSNTARKIISERILFGQKEKDELMVANEIVVGIRPKNWDKAGHPDHTVWVSMIELRQESEHLLCGLNENCFENGKCWGHLEGVMCKFLGGGGKYDTHFFCNKIQKYIKVKNVYSTHKEYNKCKQKEEPYEKTSKF